MPGLPHLNPSSITLPQTEKAFNLKEAEGYQSWQIPSIHLVLSPEFGNYYHSPRRYRSVLIMIRSVAA